MGGMLYFYYHSANEGPARRGTRRAGEGKNWAHNRPGKICMQGTEKSNCHTLMMSYLAVCRNKAGSIPPCAHQLHFSISGI
jgi:hypothetical protein